MTTGMRSYYGVKGVLDAIREGRPHPAFSNDRGHQFEWQTSESCFAEPRDLNPAYLRPEREILIEALTSAIQIMEHAEALNGARIYFTYDTMQPSDTDYPFKSVWPIDDNDIPF